MLQIFQVLDLGPGMFRLVRQPLQAQIQQILLPGGFSSSNIERSPLMEGGKGSSRRERHSTWGVYRLEQLQKLLFLVVPLVLFHLQNTFHSVASPGTTSLWVQQLA